MIDVSLKGKKNNSISEEYKALYFNLRFTHDSAQHILFSSTMDHEGSSLCAINYASSLAAMGKSTCIVDMDFRNPTIHHELSSQETTGMMDVLNGSAGLKEATQQSSLDRNLSFITAGSVNDDPLRLIMSTRFQEAINALRKQFDHIIFLAPPCMKHTDVLALSSHMDVNIFLVEQDVTGMREIEHLEQFHESKQIPNMALVFSNRGVKSRALNYFSRRA